MIINTLKVMETRMLKKLKNQMTNQKRISNLKSSICIILLFTIRTNDKFLKNFYFVLFNFNKGSLFSIDTILLQDNNFTKFTDKTYTFKKKNNKNEVKDVVDEMKQFLTKTVRLI